MGPIYRLFDWSVTEETAVKYYHVVASFIVFCFITIPQGSNAQDTHPARSFVYGGFGSDVAESVVLTFSNTPLREALTTFTERTGIVLVYSMAAEKLNRPVTATIIFETPITALRKILRGTDLEIMLSSTGRIVLVPHIKEAGTVARVSGTVTDQATGNPIPQVNVYLEELHLGTVTDERGFFALSNIPSGNYTIRASHIGYEPALENIELVSGETDLASVQLSPAIFRLGDIYVNDRGAYLYEGGLGISGSRIEQNEVEQPGLMSIGQVLRTRVAGITFFEYGLGAGAGSLQFRGVGSFHNPTDYVRINVDGIPVDGIYWETFITDNLSRVEILRGPQASGQYGASAMSGVINLYTDAGTPGSVGARLSAAGGLAKSPTKDFDPLWQEYFGSIGGGSDIITSGITLRHTRDEGILVNKGSRLSAVTAGTRIKPSDKFSVRGSFRFSQLTSGWPYSQNIQTLGDISLMNPDVSSRQQRGIASVNIDLDLFTWWHQRFIIGTEYLYGTLEYTTSEYSITGENSIMQERWQKMQESNIHVRPTVHYNTKFTIDMGGNERGTFSAGIEVQREDRSRDITREDDFVSERIFKGGSEQTIVGQYMSWAFHSAENLDIVVGFRIDQIRAEGKTFNYPMSPSLNVGYRFDVANKWIGVLRGSVGRGIRHPHYSMIFGRPPAEIPNPELSAEIMDGWEAGFSHFLLDGKLSFTTTYFSQETHDAFQSVSVRDVSNAYQWINGGKVSNRGLEVEANIMPSEWLHFGVAHIFHWNRAIDMGQENPHEFTMLRVPDVAGSVYMGIRPVRQVHLNFDLYYVGERLDVDLEKWHREGRSNPANNYERMFPPYIKIDMFGRYTVFDEHQLFVSIFNLLNDLTREYSGIPPSGRMIIFGLRYTI
jgi:outer membrane receptor protein involved in Fe transport